MWEWFSRLFGGKEQATAASATRLGKQEAGEGARKLTQLDVPMITARVRRLGVLERLDERDHPALDRIIKQRCREGRVEQWWGPLRAFAQLRAGREANPFFLGLDAAPKTLGQLERQVVALETFVTGRRFQVLGLARQDGAPVDPDEAPANGEYQVRYREADQDHGFALHVEAGKVDVVDLVGTLNSLFRRYRWPDRLFLLPADGDCHGVIPTLETTAREVAEVGWGTLHYAQRQV